jgi:hypothetical protein
MPTVIATPGLPTANSYETVAEASEYFDNRLPLSPPWPGDTTESAQAIIMATRTMDAYARPLTTKVVIEGVLYYVTKRTWTGAPATTTQALAWPRTGMFDGNGNPLDVGIDSISTSSPVIVRTKEKHRLQDGMTAFLFDTNSIPSVDGAYVVTVLTPYAFTVPVTTVVAGFEGRVTVIPRELKYATAEFAGQLLIEDRTLDSDVAKQKITALRASSVALSFGEGVQAQVIPDATLNLLVPSWLTNEVVNGAVTAEWEVI